MTFFFYQEIVQTSQAKLQMILNKNKLPLVFGDLLCAITSQKTAPEPNR